MSLPRGQDTSRTGAAGRPGYSPIDGWRVSLWPLAALMIFVIAVTVVFGSASQVMSQTVTIALIQLLFVVALYLFVGNSGILSFGHMAFAAVGAYTAAILIMEPSSKTLLVPDLFDFLLRVHSSATVAVFIGGLVAAALALVLAPALMRLSGIGASLSTLAVLVIVNVVAGNWQQVTNGATGFAGIPKTAGTGDVLGWVLVAMAVAFAFQRSRWGMRLKATREDEVAAKAVGISVVRERSMAWVLSAFLTGCGGALYAQFLSSVTPSEFFLDSTFIVVAMLVIGGTNSLTGAVAGAAVVTVSAELLRRIEAGSLLGFMPDAVQRPGLTEVALALIMLLILARRPSGLAGGQEIHWPRSRSRHRDRARTSTSNEQIEVNQ